MPSFPEGLQRDVLFCTLQVDYVYEALGRGTQVIVVGDPRVKSNLGSGAIPFLHWTGFEFYWESLGGDTKEICSFAHHLNIDEYLERLDRWDYALRSLTVNPLAQSYINAGIKLREVQLAMNRHGQSISLALVLPNSSGRIWFLPFGQLEPQDALRTILKEVLNISIAQEAPEWLVTLIAPGQPELDSHISELSATIANTELLRETQYARRVALRKCLDVLYQIGAPLEEAVRSLLTELGAEIEEGSKKGNSDGLLLVKFGDEYHRAVLEIKGTRKAQFDLKGLRQLLQWRDDALFDHSEQFRPIFIGNNAIEVEPVKRENPFNEQWYKLAQQIDATVMTTASLYEAYHQVKSTSLDPIEFWQAVFQTKGIFTMNALGLKPSNPVS